MAAINSSRPRTYLLGINDVSERQIPVEQIEIPSHLPYMPFFAEKGPANPQITQLGAAIKHYGSRSFDVTSEYATHQTPFINLAIGNGNPVMLHRIIPPNAKTAMLRLSVEVIETELPSYERNADGSIHYTFDAYGQRIPKTNGSPIKGYRLVFHTTVEPYIPQYTPTLNVDGGASQAEPMTLATADGAALFGTATPVSAYRQGNVAPSVSSTDVTSLGSTDKTSTLYPLFDLLVADPGGYGNRLGLRIQLPSTRSATPIDLASVYVNNSYLYRLGLVERSLADDTLIQLPTKLGELSLDVSFKPGARTDRTGIVLDIAERFINNYKEDTEDYNFPAPFDKLHVYRESFETVSNLLLTSEAMYDSERVGFGSAAIANKPYLLNLLGGTDEQGIPYFTIDTRHSAVFGGVSVSNDTTLFASLGNDGLPKNADGTFDQLGIYALYDEAVRNIAETFDTNPSIRFKNYAKYPMTAIWDSGFSIDTKKSLLNILSIRKDVNVVLGTHAVMDYTMQANPGDSANPYIRKPTWMPATTTEEELSISGMLKTYAALYPESEIYGTPVCRVDIAGLSGRVLNSAYTKRLPLTYEYLNKVTKFMGSPNGRWDSNQAFDQRGNNLVELMTDINITWMDENVADKAWANGLIYVEDYDTKRLFFPAFRTVYNNDTSVLNSSITKWAACLIERVCHMTWRNLTGNAKWSPSRFLDESDREIAAALADVFDDRFIIRPETFYTEADQARGYSWSTNVHIYAPNMKTVGTFSIVSHRLEDYQTTS